MDLFVTKALASSDDAAIAWAIGGGLVFIWIIIAVFVLIGLGIWIWALVDCLKKEFPSNEKSTWLIVLGVGFFFGFGWLAAIIYLIAGRPKGIIKILDEKKSEPQDAPKAPHHEKSEVHKSK